jgi:hypothetical protein
VKSRFIAVDSNGVTPEELLDQVTDRDSFIAFVEALASEREHAEQLEREQPQRYCLGGADGWENASISSFLGSSLAYFSPGQFHTPESEPSWRMFADFLYFGKIYE